MKIIKSHKVEDFQEKSRIYDYCTAVFSDFIPSRKGIKKAIKKGEILLNGQKVETGRFVKKGDVIELTDNERNIPKIYNQKLEIVYEDEFIAVIIKPAGISVSGNLFRTITNALPYNLKKSLEKDVLKYPKPVHRIDNQTAGLLIIAKTSKAIMILGDMFEKKQIEKKYYAIAIGITPEKFKTNFDIDNKKSITYFKRIKLVKSIKNNHLSLLEIEPKTGRTHQIRIHLAKSGFPILGDKLYGTKNMILKRKGLFLFACELNFTHPVSSKKINIKFDIPHKFNYLLQKEEEMYIKKYEKR